MSENITDWTDATNKYVKAVDNFFITVFDIYETRGKVGVLDGMKFLIHPNEGNHKTPHIHAELAEFKISISLIDFSIIAGNLPKRNTKAAIDWVKKNHDWLISEWDDTHEIKVRNILRKSKLLEVEE